MNENETIKGFDTKKNFEDAGINGGISSATRDTVNKSFEEERFHARQGHGFAAERANDLFDKLSGHDSKILGDNNAKNGADRIVDGIYIQSKYCSNGSSCINECFDDNGNGMFRYMVDGKPMQIEVPNDEKIYNGAIQAMEEKIKRGQVKGVTDPKEAENIVRRGHFSYQQAKNIAKAGTVESITYDAVNGVIIASSAFGISALVTFAVNIWSGEKPDIALKEATYSGLKVGGIAFASSVVAGQLSKMGLNSALVSSTESFAKLIGPKASAFITNAFRGAKGYANIYGSAAIKSAAKLFRGNLITSGVTFVLLETSDVVNIFRGRMSSKQFIKNLTNTGMSIGGGGAGSIAGAGVGGTIFPGLGHAAGAVIGGILGATGTGKLSKKVTDKITPDDAEVMLKILQIVFEELSAEYLLNKEEAEKIVQKLKDKLSGSLLKDMYSSAKKKQFAKKLLVPLIEDVVTKREKIKVPTEDEAINSLKTVLEDLADNAKANE